MAERCVVAPPAIKVTNEQDKNGKAPAAGGATGNGSAAAANCSKAKPDSSLKERTTKAQRRAMQEAQRAAKAERMAADGKAPSKPKGKSQKSTDSASAASSATASSATAAPPSSGAEKRSAKGEHRISASVQADDPKVQAKLSKQLGKQNIQQRPGELKCRLFSHLHQHRRDFPLTMHMTGNNDIHPAVLQLGLMYANYTIRGANARCIALLRVLRVFVADYTTPPQKEMARDLEAMLKPQISFLNTCRLISPSMGNAIKHTKLCISQLSPDLPEEEAKDKLLQQIIAYKTEKISVARIAIVSLGASQITDGNVVVTFGYSTVVHQIFKEAHNNGVSFRVVVADSRPFFEGRKMIHFLEEEGIDCSHLPISALCYVLSSVSLVIMGASSVTSNGYCVSRVGTAGVASTANRYSVPVIIACESHKFSERVQSDSIVFNELGDPNDLVYSQVHGKDQQPRKDSASKALQGWDLHPNLALVNLLYDVVRPEHVSMLLTEVGQVPCSSAPAVLRIKMA